VRQDDFAVSRKVHPWVGETTVAIADANSIVLSRVDIGKAFLAGSLSVLIFQQGLALLLYQAGVSSRAPYPMNPVPPFGVPQTLSAAFWGGLWGIILAAVLRSVGSGLRYWLTAILFGGIVVSAVLLFVVFPIKGRPLAAGWDMHIWFLIFCSHALFGLGTAILLRVFSSLRR
jgi:hypothetical protein